MNSDVKLQILICTIGQKGIDSIGRHRHPIVNGVKYLILLQNPYGEDIIIPDKLKRNDFSIVTSDTRGISVNRNIGIENATAPFALISDDDVDYDSSELISVIESFESHPGYDILAFKFHSNDNEKLYPSTEHDIVKPPKGYYVTSIEIGFRVPRIKPRIRFNENFGIGSHFICGEESIFIHDALRAGLKACFIPEYSCRHDSISTGNRERNKPEFIMAHAAAMSHIHPRSWIPRIAVHAWRNYRSTDSTGFVKYLICAIKGVTVAKRMKVFGQLLSTH